MCREAPAASARAARGRADGPPRSTRVRLVAERGPCDVRARARGAHVGTRARPRRGRARLVWCRGGMPCGSCMCWDGVAERLVPPARARAQARGPKRALHTRMCARAHPETRSGWRGCQPAHGGVPCLRLHWWRCHARLRSVLWQMRAACRRDGVRTSWSLGTAVPDLDGALRSADPRPGPCLPAGGGLVAEGDPRRTLTFSTRGGVDARLISHRWPARTCPHSAPHLAMRLSLRSSLPCARACHPRPGLLGASTNPVFSLENWYASQFGV